VLSPWDLQPTALVGKRGEITGASSEEAQQAGGSSIRFVQCERGEAMGRTKKDISFAGVFLF